MKKLILVCLVTLLFVTLTSCVPSSGNGALISSDQAKSEEEPSGLTYLGQQGLLEYYSLIRPDGECIIVKYMHVSNVAISCLPNK